MQTALPIVQDIVLVGGGHTHALVALMWAMDPLPGVRLTLINPGPVAPYTGMLPGFVAGHYQRDEIMIDLIALARRAGARIILDRAVGLDLAARQVLLERRGRLGYDLCSVDIGITSDLPDLAGFAEYGLAAKPLSTFAERWEAFATAPRRDPARVVVIGGGIGGVELALAAQHRLAGSGPAPQVSLVERGDALMAALPAGARRVLHTALRGAGITVHLGAEPSSLRAGELVLGDGRILPADMVLSVAGARPQPWLAETGLALHQGFIAVDRHLRSSDPAVFAAGDCAHLTGAPRPKAGVFAVRQAPVLLANLKAAVTGGALRPYAPQGDYLKLISLGGKSALAEKWGLVARGAALWRQKDRIDRAFMDRFAPMPMPPPALSGAAARVPGLAEALGTRPLCGGCGAKLGPLALTGALSALPQAARADVLRGVGDDAAVLRHGAGLQVITTDHLRAFTADAGLMARLTVIHALGDIWAMGAAPQVALSQVTLPRLSEAKAAEMLAEITAAAAEVLRAEGADLVGGHSSTGAELTIGFTITGLAERALGKTGARAGDALILTKPIGTGTILAAEMSGLGAPGLILGEAVAAALAQMGRPQGAAARILAPHARAMTDVTGFGLAGHLAEMLAPGGLSADLEAAALPLLPGALALAQAGAASSLAQANRAGLQGRLEMDEGPLKALMVDPQTCGGLLAALPAEQAAPTLDRLRAAGVIAARIGTVAPGPLSVRVR
ncbi:MAG: selenide, water dikinase SelD [Paracoccaceae bacterium]